jgi:predicted ATP-binding protein involved in virulence
MPPQKNGDARREAGKAVVHACEVRGVIAHYGESHQVMLDADRLIRFQWFRLAKRRPEGA